MGVMGEECEFCGKPPFDERLDRGRKMTVCEECAHEYDANAELQREEDAYERAVDQSLSEWKDEGKVGFPRAVVRRGRR